MVLQRLMAVTKKKLENEIEIIEEARTLWPMTATVEDFSQRQQIIEHNSDKGRNLVKTCNSLGVETHTTFVK